jgi:DNA-directed RNA polymerase specialized sigma24 family protein
LTYRVAQGRVTTWLASITRNRAIDVFRRSRSRLEHLQISWEAAESLNPPSPQNVEAEVDRTLRLLLQDEPQG